MRFEELYKHLIALKYYLFSKDDLSLMYPNESSESLNKSLYRWSKSNLIIPLKKGLYELNYASGNFNIPDFYVANKLYSPSYISLETVLSNHSIIPEVSMAVTSVTPKPTRKFKNKHGLFIYRSLKKELFCGYYTEKYLNYEFQIAEPEKALVDYLYLNSFYKKPYDLSPERIDKDVVLKLKQGKLKKYLKLIGLNLEVLYAHL